MDERMAIICATCHVNRANKQLSASNWPWIDTGDPLRDKRVAELLQK